MNLALFPTATLSPPVEKQQNLPPNVQKTNFLSPFPMNEFSQNATYFPRLGLPPAQLPTSGEGFHV
jgi:hypothetical protein